MEEIFKRIDYPYNQVSKWVFESIKPLSSKHVAFSEYVHMVAYFIMLASERDVCKFLFRSLDVENTQYLRKEQFHQLTEIIAENSPFNVKVWQLQWVHFHDKKLKFMFLTHWLAFVKVNPSTLWQVQLLQRKFMQDNLGVLYWENKIEQFRIVRQDLEIKLL